MANYAMASALVVETLTCGMMDPRQADNELAAYGAVEMTTGGRQYRIEVVA